MFRLEALCTPGRLMPRHSGRSPRTHQYDGTTYRELLRRLAANVRRLRAARGWTQEEAAHQCRMTTAFVQSIEGEATNPTSTPLARLADGLGADLTELFAPAPPLPPRRPGRPRKRLKALPVGEASNAVPADAPSAPRGVDDARDAQPAGERASAADDVDGTRER